MTSNTEEPGKDQGIAAPVAQPLLAGGPRA